MMPRSQIWSHFTRVSPDSDWAKCDHCHKSFKHTAATTGLWYHLQKAHKIEKNETKDEHGEPDTKKSKVQVKIMLFVTKESLELIISKLAATDGLAFNVIAKSEFIQRSLRKEGYKPPEDATAVGKLVLKYAEEKKEELKALLAKKVANGTRFSTTMDEWTSGRNRRYFNFNLHWDGAFKSLRMIRIDGHFTAEDAVHHMKKLLAMFGLSMDKHIIASTTDGASMMKKIGRITKPEHQLCLAHGIHLAVTDVLYKDKVSLSLFDLIFE